MERVTQRGSGILIPGGFQGPAQFSPHTLHLAVFLSSFLTSLIPLMSCVLQDIMAPSPLSGFGVTRSEVRLRVRLPDLACKTFVFTRLEIEQHRRQDQGLQT